MTKVEFLDAYKKFFLDNSELKLRFRMGEDYKGEDRVNAVLKKFEEIASFLFRNKEIWVLLIIWDANGENKRELLKGGFNKNLASNCYRGKIDDGLVDKKNFDREALEGAEILYIKYNHFSFSSILPIVYSKAGFELGLESTAGILAYFMCFKDYPVLLNLYDDRGMELLSHDSEIIDSVGKKFSSYLMQ